MLAALSRLEMACIAGRADNLVIRSPEKNPHVSHPLLQLGLQKKKNPQCGEPALPFDS